MDNPFRAALDLGAETGADETGTETLSNPFRAALEVAEPPAAPAPAPISAPSASLRAAMPAPPALPAPAEEPGIFTEIAAMGPAIARGGAGTIAGAAEGMGIAQAQRTQRLMGDFDAIDRGEIPPSRLAAAETTTGLTDLTLVLGDLGRYEQASPEARKIIRAEIMPRTDPRNTELFNWGDELRKTAEGAFPTDPRFEGSFSQAVGQAIGSMAAFMVSGIGTGGVTALPMGISGGSAEQFRDALQQGASLEEAMSATNWGAAIGATEFLPIMRIFTRANKATGGGIRKGLLRGAKAGAIAGGKGGAEETLQETFASVANNLVASDVVAYDPERGTFQGTDQAAGAGFSAGALAGTLAYLLGGRRSTGEVRDALRDVVNERQEPTLGDGGPAPPEGPTLDPVPPGTATPPVPPTAPPAPPGAPPEEPGTTTPPPPVTPPAPDAGPESAPPPPPPRPVSPPSEVSAVYTVGGKRANVRPEIVELDTLIASHDLAGVPNAAYPQELQPRNRTKDASRDQVAHLVSKMNPALLAPSPLASEGSPIVGLDNFVDSGNARTLAIRQLYQTDNPIYSDWLKSQGYDLSGFRQPVLIQRRVGDMTTEERIAFNTDAATPSNLKRSATEVAATDAKNVTPALMQGYQGGELTQAINRQFVRDFIRNVTPLTERGDLYTDDGELSQDGERRIEGAIYAYAFGESEILSRMREDRNSSFKAIGNALIDAAPAWAVMRNSIDNAPQYDVTETVIRAVRIVRMARQQGVPVSTILGQTDAFDGPVSPAIKAAVRLFYNNDQMTNWSAEAKVKDRLRYYADEAPKMAQQAGTVFGDVIPPLSPLDLLKQAVAPPGQHLAGDPNVAARVESGESNPFADVLAQTETLGMGPPGEKNLGQRRPKWDPSVKRRAKPITREKALRDLTKALGFSIYQGRIKMRSPLLGFYRPLNEEIRLKKPADIETAIHEAAHLLDFRFPEIRRQWNPATKANKTVREELRQLSYDQEKLFEGFAEFVRFWATQPEHAKEHAPQFSEWWEGFLKRYPKEGKAVRKFKTQAQDWFNQSELDKMRAKIGDKGPINAAVNGIWGRFRQSVLDDLHGIYTMERDVTGTIQPAGAYVASRLTRGSVRLFVATLEKGVPVLREDGSIGSQGPGLNQILKPVMSELDNWKLYAVGRSASELKAQGREFLFTSAELEAAASLENPAFRKAFNEYQTWNNGILDFAQALGIINPDQRAMWKRAEYLPFYRVATQIGAGGDRGGRPGEWGGIKALRGGMTNIRDPLENIQANAAMLIDMAVKNRARQEVAKFARQKGGGKYLTRIAPETRAVKVSKGEVERVIFQSLGVSSLHGLPIEVQPYIDNLIRGLGPMTTFFLHNQPPKGTNVLTVYRGGQPTYYEVADPVLLRSLSAFTRPHPGGVRRILGVARRLVQMGITLTADFMSANIFRDTITGAVLSRNSALPFVESAKGFAARIRKDEDYWEFVYNGGGFSSFLVDEDAYRARVGAFYKKKGINPRNVILGLRSMALALETAAEAFEVATRIGEFKKAKGRGKSSSAAAYEAREISTDWAMRGDSQVLGSLYDTIIFLKAGMVSLDRVYRGFAHDPNKFSIMWKTALIAGLSMGLYALNRGNPLFDELEDWDRDGHWHFFFPTEAYYEFIERHGRGPQTPEEAKDLFIHIRLPKIWEIGAIASISERTAEAISGEDVDTWQAIRGIFANLFGFEYVPAAIEPIYEQLLNEERFTGTPIVGRGQQDMQPWAQYRSTTSDTAKWLGKALGVSPLRVEHMVLGYLNTWGRYGLTLTDALFFDDGPDLRLDQLPVMRRFYREQPARRTRHVSEFYDMLEAATEARKTIHAMRRRRQPAEFQRLVESRDMAADDMLLKANESMGSLRGMRDRILGATDVAELQRAAMEWRKQSWPGAGEQLWREARHKGTWDDIGALKLLLRDALTVRRNALAREVVETVKARQREAE